LYTKNLICILIFQNNWTKNRFELSMRNLLLHILRISYCKQNEKKIGQSDCHNMILWLGIKYEVILYKYFILTRRFVYAILIQNVLNVDCSEKQNVQNWKHSYMPPLPSLVPFQNRHYINIRVAVLKKLKNSLKKTKKWMCVFILNIIVTFNIL